MALEMALSRLMSPDREVRRSPPRRSPRRWSPGCARARSSSTRCSTTRRSTTACATTRTGSPRATWPTRRATSRWRRSSTPCAAATRSPQRWYRLKARLLGVDRLADYDRIGRGDPGGRDRSAGRGARRSCSTPTRRSRPSWATVARRFFDERWIDAPGAAGQARRRVLRLHRAVRPPVRVAQLDGAPPRRAHARARARPRRARRARARARASSTSHAADAGRDRVGVRRDGHVRPPARGRRETPESRLCAAGREHRGLDRHRVPPGGDEPVRGPRAHTRGASEGELSVDAVRRAVGRDAGGDASATRSRSPRATARGGRTSRTSSTRPATSTRTPTASCWRCRSTSATTRRARRSCPRYLELLAAGGSRPPEELGASSASTSPTPASGTPASTSSRSSSRAAEEAARSRAI